jgi:hypothetical protein
MRSAVYYPRTTVQSRSIMQSSLLLWDKLHTIVPMPHYAPEYTDQVDLAEAWEMIGAKIVPNEAQKRRTHDAIDATLATRRLPPNLSWVGAIDRPEDPYEIWPQKFAERTWDLMREHGLTDDQLPNGDFRFTQDGGLMVMAKLADACAGTNFARVTDRLMAYGMIGSGEQRPGTTAEVVPITLDVIDATSIPIESLLAFRRREESERRGGDYRKLRHRYADTVQHHMRALDDAIDQFERDEINRIFRDTIQEDLRDLRSELGGNRIDLVLKPVVVAGIATSGAAAAAGADHLTTALAAGVGAVFGASWKEIGSAVADLFGGGLAFDRKQREVMNKHPMAYMYALSNRR